MSAPNDRLWDRFEDVDRLFEYLLSVDPASRSRELRRACGDDAWLERTLTTLLEESDRAGRLESGPDPEILAAALDAGSPGEALPDRVGGYRILELLGRGGMGTVFLAERDDPSFPNRVALKLLRRGVDTDDVLARFRTERRILASLHHPGVASVFEAGTTEDGRPFLVMEFVDGLPITHHCDALELDLRARVELFMGVLRAVSHAHAHGVVHRDLKASNILVTREEAHVKLLDFGIAKLLAGPHTGVGHTEPHARPMTRAYASPEQLLGLPIAEASDIYQLGLLLHELLTGTRPFDTDGERRRAGVPTGEPPLPSRSVEATEAMRVGGIADVGELAAHLAGDLDAIVVRCLRRDPARRYESVAALHDDLEAYLQRRPVAARAATRGYRLRALARRRSPALRWVAATLVLSGGVAAALAYDRTGASSGPPPASWIAVAGVSDETPDAEPRLARQVDEVLFATLAPTEALQVVRLPPGPEPGALRRAALDAGAAEIVTGVVRPTASGELELLLRRARTRSGAPIDSFTARGSDIVVVAATAAGALRERLAVRPDDITGEAPSALSSHADRLVVEGLAAYGAGDERVAYRFFQAALDADSTSALAAFYAARAANLHSPHEGKLLLNRAYRLSETSPDRERLLIRSWWAAEMDSPHLGTYADSLVRRFPAEPRGHQLLAEAYMHAGDFLTAANSFERAVALDSLRLHHDAGPCVSCESFGRIVSAYLLADSMDAAVRAGERWTRLQPQSARAWHSLSTALIDVERREEAMAASRRAAELRTGDITDVFFPGLVAIHRGDFEEGDRIFRLHLSTGTDRTRITAAHWLAISLRMQGRWEEAGQAGDTLVAVARTRPEDDRLDLLGHIARGLALLESGRPADAAEVFEAIAERTNPEFSESRIARDRAWNLTHAGTARAAAGDTLALIALIDRVEEEGAKSVYGRDQRLHHYLRGLLGRLRGAPEAEIERHFRAALYSVSQGYSRINLELAESLLRQGRYEEAAFMAGAPMRNSMESNGLYATRTHFHELLGRIWHAAGRPDSAVVHLRAAREAWRDADPVMAPRVEAIERMLASYGESRAAGGA